MKHCAYYLQSDGGKCFVRIGYWLKGGSTSYNPNYIFNLNQFYGCRAQFNCYDSHFSFYRKCCFQKAFMTTVTKTDRSIKRTNQNNSSSNAPAWNRTDLWPTCLHSAWTELIYFDEQGWVQNANDVFCFLQVWVNPRLLPATVVMVTRTLSRWEGVAGNSTPWESSPYLLFIATTTKTQPTPPTPTPKSLPIAFMANPPSSF